MRTKTPTKRPVQAPKRRGEKKSRAGRWRLWAAVAAALAFGAAVAGILAFAGYRGGAGTVQSGLPSTPDYHSLLVAPFDPKSLVLGTHDGLYRSADGGLSWKAASLAGQDAMNLSGGGGVVWAAGHDVLAKSTDGGETWQDVRPAGLPGLDVHGFAVDPRDPSVLYAAIAGQGLFRSVDAGASFTLVSTEVGRGVMALAVTPDGRILAGDMQQGLFESADGGKTWKVRLRASVMGLAVNPSEPERILATGPGILLSIDGGRTWRPTMPLDAGAGPVAWSPSEPATAYVVGFDRTLYQTADSGGSWRPVGGGE